MSVTNEENKALNQNRTLKMKCPKCTQINYFEGVLMIVFHLRGPFEKIKCGHCGAEVIKKRWRKVTDE